MIEAAFGPFEHELVVLDDFTAFVEIQHRCFSVAVYTDSFPDGVVTFSVFSMRDDMDIDLLMRNRFGAALEYDLDGNGTVDDRGNDLTNRTVDGSDHISLEVWVDVE